MKKKFFKKFLIDAVFSSTVKSVNCNPVKEAILLNNF
jgi:hypothetical protein